MFEGRFDKDELGGVLPAMYEFLISKREPYEENLYDEVTVLGEIVENSAFVTAMNTSKSGGRFAPAGLVEVRLSGSTGA